MLRAFQLWVDAKWDVILWKRVGMRCQQVLSPWMSWNNIGAFLLVLFILTLARWATDAEGLPLHLLNLWKWYFLDSSSIDSQLAKSTGKDLSIHRILEMLYLLCSERHRFFWKQRKNFIKICSRLPWKFGLSGSDVVLICIMHLQLSQSFCLFDVLILHYGFVLVSGLFNVYYAPIALLWTYPWGSHLTLPLNHETITVVSQNITQVHKYVHSLFLHKSWTSVMVHFLSSTT